jgi:eukaryotic-like serine/threonine-protein kinase
MATPTTTDDFLSVVRKSRLVSEKDLEAFAAEHPTLTEPKDFAREMQIAGLITPFQAGQLVRGRHKGFVLGKYKLLDRIGMGGMGQVYLAEHNAMRRRVAVKVLPPERSESPFARERFLREARAAAALDHPHLCRVFDVENDGDVHFLVMEYLPGVSLHDLISRRGPLSPERTANYLYQTAAGLSAIHARSLVHRDIKPANLLLDRNGTVKVLDLGLVRSELDDDALTRGEGAKIVGTADFLAPEQAVNSSTVDSRADLYALGATAYYLLTGEPPFKAEKVSQKLIAHQIAEPKPVHLARPGVPADLSAVVHKLLAKKPDDRYACAAEVMAALEPWAMVPLPPPEESDFPEHAGYALPSSNAMSFALQNSGVGSRLTAPKPIKKPESKPLMKGITGGSVVRISPVPNGNPSSGSGTTTQSTAAVASAETKTDHPSSAPGRSKCPRSCSRAGRRGCSPQRGSPSRSASCSPGHCSWCTNPVSDIRRRLRRSPTRAPTATASPSEAGL